MRVHRLRLTAFGPYAGAEEIDFDELCDAGLFLIHGPTGAGKSTVLDGVCFALYGRVPGARDQARRLRSDHAPADRRPEVTLEATIRGRRLRLTRSPRWERPKKRGDGWTTEQPKVTLEEYDAEGWSALSTGLDEVGQLVSGLLGMSADQFCQVALLPQGRFARFLRASANERGEVLERLFATGVYADMERWLVEHRKQAGREKDKAVGRVNETADHIAEVAAAARPDDRQDVAGLAPWADELLRSARAADAVAEQERGDLEQALAAARDAAGHATTIAQRQRDHADALDRQRRLGERTEERVALRRELDEAHAAATVMPLITAADKRTERSESAAGEATLARRAVPTDVPDDADVEALRSYERARRDEVNRLDQLREDANRLTELDRQTRADTKKIDRLSAERDALDAKLAKLPDQRRQREAEVAAARKAADERGPAEAARQEAERRLNAARDKDAREATVGSAEQAASGAVDAAQRARDRLQTVRRARLDGMAAELAGSLHDGEPCPVCGAEEHPHPADPSTNDTTQDDEDKAREDDEQAQAKRRETEAALSKARAERDAATANAGGLTVEEATAALRARSDELDAAERAAAEVQRLQDEIGALARKIEESGQRRTRVAEDLAQAETTRRQRGEEATQLRGRVDEARGDDPTLAARVDRLDGEATRLAGAVTAVESAATAERELADALDEAQRAAKRTGFADVASARVAVHAEEDREGLRRRLREFDDEQARIRELLDNQELADAARLPAPDVDAAAAARQRAEQAHQEAVTRRERTDERANRLTELAGQLEDGLAAWRPAADRHARADELARLAEGTSGDNRWRMRLSSYVLAARLTQVAAAANERLARISDGRYTLEHTDEPGAGERRGGLTLRVADTWTSQVRDPATLSGGETFLASLALALGLADVVTAEAGGTQINTLFIDEGFGSLDEATLDEVMDTLDELRAAGRAVGIVSHVTDLRTRIPTQLRVRKTRDGSTLAR